MKYVLLIFPFLICITTFAKGVISGGGGKSVVCRNLDGTIKSAEILDLYEGRIQYGLNYKESNATAEKQILQIFSSSNIGTAQSSPPSTIYDWYFNLKMNMRFVPVGTTLLPIDDSLEVIAPKGCNIEQAVNYQNDKTILVSQEIWNALSETQRAGLMMHESIYRKLRADKETDSRRARHFTAYLFAGGKVEDTYPGNDWFAICESVKSSKSLNAFYVSRPFMDQFGDEKVRLQFSMINGRRLLSKSFFDIDNQISGNHQSTLLHNLKNPGIDYSIIGIMARPTQSAFEEGDSIGLTIGDQSSGTLLSINGTSIFDNTTFSSDIKCMFKSE